MFRWLLMHSRSRPWVSLAVLNLVWAPIASAQAPPDFSNVALATVAQPTALAFTPDGRLLIASQLGRLYVYQNGALVTQPALNFDSGVCTNSERGLLGVAVNPAFASNGFIYLYYTSSSNGCVNRVSRFTLSAANQVDRATERILIDNIVSFAGNHNAGDLRFGRDGYLYISVGDGGCDYAGDSGCAAANNAARDTHMLLGKILRITADGSIPPTNPYLGANSARCNATGRTTAGNQCQETFASGLRNPFRMAFDPNASGTRFFINDVGQGLWEEINEGSIGADYGWNIREGNCIVDSTNGCTTQPAGLTPPIHAYGRSTGCAAVTGGAFVPNGVWPGYDNVYLFADYTCGTIFTLTQSGSAFTRATFATGAGSSSITAMTFGPYNGTQALYYVTYANGGQVRRLHYAGSANRAPTASISASPRSGPTPLVVAFDGRNSSDPDGGALTFDWDFGDGSPHATSAMVSHTYSTAGLYTARLTVRDPQGLTGSATTTVDAGNRAPTVTITSPLPSTRFRVGETITLQAQATDPEEGALPASSLQWTVTLHHDTHTHPFMPPTTGNGVTFTAPSPEDFAAAATSYLSFAVTATDSRGLSATQTQQLLPRTVDLTFITQPGGRTIEVNGASLTGPRTVTSWEGYTLALNAPSQIDSGGQRWVFQSWSDGGAAQHSIVTPAGAASYTVTFAQGSPIPAGLMAAFAFDEAAGTTVNDASGRNHAGMISGATWAAGRYGLALAFDGVDDSVSIADSPDLDLTTGMTLEAWIYPTAYNGWEQILLKEASGVEAYALYGRSGAAGPTGSIARNGAATLVSTPTNLPLSSWSHVASTYDGAALRLYVNGALVSSVAISGPIDVSAGPLKIGGNSIFAEWFNGRIDDVRVYNRALTQAEIQSDMAVGVGVSAPAPPTGVRIIR